jgi:hypothetical protein
MVFPAHNLRGEINAGVTPSLRRQLFDLAIEPGEVFFPTGVDRREFCQLRMIA